MKEKQMFQNILKQYMYEQIISTEKLNTSENSFNYKLTTDKSAYILRRLKSKYQGEIEWDLSELLDEEYILPKILSTLDYKKYVECEGNYYNLQEYFQNEEIKISNVDLYKLGQQLEKFHKKTQIYHSEVWNTNAFDLNEMLKKLEKKVFFKEIAKYNSRFLKRIENAKAYELIEEDVIHGDMTLHNVLYNERKFRIIDLGEVRLGSRYFDLAGLILFGSGLDKIIIFYFYLLELLVQCS